MIAVSSAMQQDKIKELLEGYNEDGISFTFKEKQGIKLIFETTAEDKEAAAKLAKDMIKATPWGKILYLQSIPV